MATEVGFEPTHYLIQSQVPFQLGYSVKKIGEPGTIRTCGLDLRKVALLIPLSYGFGRNDECGMMNRRCDSFSSSFRLHPCTSVLAEGEGLELSSAYAQQFSGLRPYRLGLTFRDEVIGRDARI